MLLNWARIPKPIMYDRGKPMLFIMYTKKKGVAILSANTHTELNRRRFLEFAFCSGLFNSRKIFSFARVVSTSGVCERKYALPRPITLPAINMQAYVVNSAPG